MSCSYLVLALLTLTLLLYACTTSAARVLSHSSAAGSHTSQGHGRVLVDQLLPAPIKDSFVVTAYPNIEVVVPLVPDVCNEAAAGFKADADFWALASPATFTALQGASSCNRIFTACALKDSDFVGSPYECPFKNARVNVKLVGQFDLDACKKAHPNDAICDTDILLSALAWNSPFGVGNKKDRPTAVAYLQGPWIGPPPETDVSGDPTTSGVPSPSPPADPPTAQPPTLPPPRPPHVDPPARPPTLPPPPPAHVDPPAQPPLQPTPHPFPPEGGPDPGDGGEWIPLPPSSDSEPPPAPPHELPPPFDKPAPIKLPPRWLFPIPPRAAPTPFAVPVPGLEPEHPFDPDSPGAGPAPDVEPDLPFDSFAPDSAAAPDVEPDLPFDSPILAPATC